MTELGTKIRNELKKRGITQTEFEETTGISRITLMPCRHKTRLWRKVTVYAAASFLGMTVEELICGTDMEDLI